MNFTVQSQGQGGSKVLAIPAQMDTVTATFVYDGDGNRVAQTINGETTYFIGNYYEVTDPGPGQTVTKYYYAGSQRVAMRNGTTLSYLLSDHLGSTSLTTNSGGSVVSELRYTAWGEIRYPADGQNPGPSDYTYTGQYSNVSDFGLMFYNARWYDPALGRFAQADTIVPGGVQGYDRYAYANNSPLKYVDPSGHGSVCGQAYSDPECNEVSKSPNPPPIIPHADSGTTQSSGTVYAGQYFPTGYITFGSLAEESWTEGTPEIVYVQSIGSMSGEVRTIYGANIIVVANDYLRSFAPVDPSPSPNVFALVDWEYEKDAVMISGVRVANNSPDWVKILFVTLEPLSGQKTTIGGPSDWVGHRGDEPGIGTFDMVPHSYSRNDSIVVTVAMKSASWAYPAAVSVLIPGQGLRPGYTPVSPWYSSR